MNIVHVGLGKTGTSSLQKHVFSTLKAKGLVDTYNDERWYHAITEHRYIAHRPEAQSLAKFFHDDEGLHFISKESLLTWNPAHWQEDCDYLQTMFGAQSTILLTLRSPKSYLRSVYQQRVHEGHIIPAEHFFLCSKRYEETAPYARTRLGGIFNCDALHYQALVDLLAARFEKVVVVSIDGVNDLSFMQKLLELTPEQLASLQEQFTKHRCANKSYSEVAMRLTFARERFLKALGLKSCSSLDLALCSSSKDDSLSHIWFKDLSPIQKLRVLPKRALTWRRFMQSIVSKYIAQKPYLLPEGIYLGQHLEANTAFYDALRSEQSGYRVYTHSASEQRDRA